MAVLRVERAIERSDQDQAGTQDVGVSDSSGDGDDCPRPQVVPNSLLVCLAVQENQKRHLTRDDEKTLRSIVPVIAADIRHQPLILEAKHVDVFRHRKVGIEQIVDVTPFVARTRTYASHALFQLHMVPSLLLLDLWKNLKHYEKNK